jgi:dTDP-4-dehydrorhamnose reductase
VKILVFGKLGQVAAELGLCSNEHDDTEVIHIDRKVANLEYPEQCADAIYLNKPDVIINAAAYTNVEKAEEEEELANIINGSSPKVMAEAAHSIGCPLIHLSTDYVFDDQVKGPKSIDVKPNPLNAYGRSKLLGEKAIQESGCIYIILRTSWIFSSHGSNFVKSVLNVSKTNNILRVVSDQIGGPTSAKELAKTCLNIAHRVVKDSSLKGIYHYSGSPDISWSSFAEAIFKKNNKVFIEKIETSAYPSKVIRPYNSSLDCSSLEETFGIARPLWRRDLEIILKELEG